MVISFANQAGSILSYNQWWNDAGIESIVFANGTIWSEAEIAARYLAAQTTSAADTIWGTNWADTLEGGDGNDAISGGTYGNDVFIGGAGNDSLSAGRGRATFVYNPGDGDDVIYDDTYYNDGSAPDTLLFGAGIDPEDIVFSRGPNITDLRIGFAGQPGSILIANQWWGDAGVESISFADGTVWSEAQIAAFYVAAQTTSGNDTIWGSSHADLVLGGDSDDLI